MKKDVDLKMKSYKTSVQTEEFCQRFVNLKMREVDDKVEVNRWAAEQQIEYLKKHVTVPGYIDDNKNS